MRGFLRVSQARPDRLGDFTCPLGGMILTPRGKQSDPLGAT